MFDFTGLALYNSKDVNIDYHGEIQAWGYFSFSNHF